MKLKFQCWLYVKLYRFFRWRMRKNNNAFGYFAQCAVNVTATIKEKETK